MDASVRAIAVLPLQNLSGDPAQEYVADGMTSELISELGRLDAMTVISQTSVMQYKTERPSVREIADALDVDWILEGGVAREADTIRANVNPRSAATMLATIPLHRRSPIPPPPRR